jgi:antitoxin CptB
VSLAPEHRRLRWLCRRGTRELDALLSGFLDGPWADSPDSVRQAFARLLEWPDPDLYDCLIGRRATGDPELDDVVARIRAAADY